MLKFKINKFRKDKRGIAGVEFALIAPVILVLLLGTIELSNYIMLDRRANYSAQYLADFLSRDPDNLMEMSDRNQSLVIYAMTNPNLKDQYQQRYGDKSFWVYRRHTYSFASIEFDPVDPDCTSVSCAYEPDLSWWYRSSRYLGRDGNSLHFDCDLELTASTVPLNGKNVPEEIVGRSAAIITSLGYKYEPLFVGGLFNEHVKVINAIRKTRSGSLLRDGTNDVQHGSTYHRNHCP